MSYEKIKILRNTILFGVLGFIIIPIFIIFFDLFSELMFYGSYGVEELNDLISLIKYPPLLRINIVLGVLLSFLGCAINKII